jgi:hypothetical protein
MHDDYLADTSRSVLVIAQILWLCGFIKASFAAKSTIGARVCINNRNEGGAVVKIAVRNRREDERS